MPEPATSRSANEPVPITVGRTPTHGDDAAGRPAAVLSMMHINLSQEELHRKLNAEDGTRQLLLSGFWIAVFGAAAMLPVLLLFGGVGPQGAHSNAGWLSLLVSLMSEPFGVLLLGLGGAKWLRNRSLSRRSF